VLKRFVVPLFAVAALALPAAAVADSCANVSRAPAPCGMTCTGPVVDGNWVWLPSVGAPLAAWGFGVPSNYLNSGGGEAWLLENTPYCEAGGVLFYNGPRTTEHGIQSGCGFFD